MDKGNSYKKLSLKKGDLGFNVTENTELLKFLITKLPGKNRNNIKTLLKDRQVLVNDKAISQHNHPLIAGDKVSLRWEKIPEEKQYHGYTILYEDKHLVVIDKHAGILSVSTPGKNFKTAYSMLSDHVKKQDPTNKIFIVHRLDRDTSGVMMFAKSKTVQENLQKNWHVTVEERTYLAVVKGIPEKKEEDIVSYVRESKALIVYSSQDPSMGLHAVTHYKVVRHNQHYSLLQVDIETGRKNQIRVHLNDIGHPIVGDKKYGSTINPIGRLCLHAWVLAFTHPVSGEKMRFESEVPKKFKVLV